MNKSTIKSMLWLCTASLLITFTACKKKTETATPTPVVPAKTLDKTALTNNKTWYSQGSLIVHDFKNGGVYGGSGSWNWVNNSDTMEIIMISGDPKMKWKFNWNTDKEMECEWIGRGGARLCKDKAW